MAIKLIECPRDAMQGLHDFIPTEIKIAYLNQLLKVGFDTLDFGSFVSPKAIPQMVDTVEVLSGLELNETKTKLLAIVANTRGAMDACKHEAIHYLGFPFSVSETFQQRNTNSSMGSALVTVQEMQDLCVSHNKELVVYLSMGFGNPYGDPWNAGLVAEWAQRFVNMGIRTISLSDTIGVATPENISYLFGELIPQFTEVTFGAHLHTTPDTWLPKIEAAYNSGCRRFDGAMKGLGGCPMATDQLTGNMPTENLWMWFKEQQIETNLNDQAFLDALRHASSIFEGRT